MAYAVINTREDLNTIIGTPEHEAFMTMLRGSLYRLEKDDTAAVWRAIEDSSTIERFGFTRADFPGAEAPELPLYIKEDLTGKARAEARAHIIAIYPEWKQLNILRAGVQADIAKMGAFIDACRDWSNGENPDPAALSAIAP